MAAILLAFIRGTKIATGYPKNTGFILWLRDDRKVASSESHFWFTAFYLNSTECGFVGKGDAYCLLSSIVATNRICHRSMILVQQIIYYLINYMELKQVQIYNTNATNKNEREIRSSVSTPLNLRFM